MPSLLQEEIQLPYILSITSETIRMSSGRIEALLRSSMDLNLKTICKIWDRISSITLA